ncbi:type II toxin-antitoxin system VapC family toxin [Saccharopolyspora sp. 5N708]|uniref:type II toxin-antitoxin system VapC family toxin n=1 Tax=Saccharopolyspora sp. 5N708 TaxID=3457424 RepID=UPI003FD03644
MDASALTEVLTATRPALELRRRIELNQAVAPDIIDLEVSNVLRKMLRSGKLSQAKADRAIELLTDSPIARSPHRPLLPRIWELRHAVTTYDATYVALSERLGIPLITCDKKLAGSNGHEIEIEYFPLS